MILSAKIQLFRHIPKYYCKTHASRQLLVVRKVVGRLLLWRYAELSFHKGEGVLAVVGEHEGEAVGALG